jgi:UDP-N-acetylglucosamine 2-epimerase (hydrolysing)
MTKKIVFLTGTRADFGKQKSLIIAAQENNLLEVHVFVTGMHTLSKFGNTKKEVINSGIKNIQIFNNQIDEEPMDLILANTINGFGRYIHELRPDLIIVHGDRIEALAGAICGALSNVLVAHIEGGEISGTIDESIRHSISKLSHIHFVSNQQSMNLLLQMGERKDSIHLIGSPDIDIILKRSKNTLESVKKRYSIPYNTYSIIILHPVTTDNTETKKIVQIIKRLILHSGDNFIIIDPNNDIGFKDITKIYDSIDIPSIRRFPSIRFEFFIQLLKSSKCIIGNSSAGIHEAPVLGIPTISIGTRQLGRYKSESISEVPLSFNKLLDAYNKIELNNRLPVSNYFGDGKSKNKFMKILSSEKFWNTPIQKRFVIGSNNDHY